MDTKTLTSIYDQMTTTAREYERNKAYVSGKNPTILNKPREGTPDNRVPIPLAKMAVDDMCGYAGRAEDIQISFVPVDKDGDIENADKYSAIARSWMDYNSDKIETAELYREALSQGKAYEIFWTSDETEPGFVVKPEYKIVPGSQVHIEYSNGLKPVKLYAVRFWGSGEDKHAVVYYPLFAEGWVSTNGGEWQRDKDQDLVYPYKNVPVIEYKMNRDGMPLFEAEKSIIDAIDNTVGKSINEIDRFNALILLLPALADPGIKAKLVEARVIDDLNRFDHWPEYLEKNLNGVSEFYKWVEKLLEESFRKSIKIPDMTDQSFGGTDESGVARAFKMLGMEFVASGVETYFKPSLYERKGFFDDCINAGTSGIDTEAVTIEVTCKRNMPMAESERITIAQGLQALGISQETILRVIPSTLIPDVMAELERMKEAADNRVKLIDDNSNNDTNNTDDANQ